MKPTNEERLDLARRIATARSDSPLSDAEIGRLSGVHPSQVGRICRGGFRTISNNVVQICCALGLPVRVVESSGTPADRSWQKLERSVHEAWDRTPEGAAKLVKILRAVADIRRAGNRP